MPTSALFEFLFEIATQAQASERSRSNEKQKNFNFFLYFSFVLLCLPWPEKPTQIRFQEERRCLSLSSERAMHARRATGALL
jgi:hypothetical protein